jgi:ssDNA-binding Zn-finger/Zn-ribbon topoisomerase 1
VVRRRLQSPPGLFWGCSRYPACEYTENMSPEQDEHFTRWRQ